MLKYFHEIEALNPKWPFMVRPAVGQEPEFEVFYHHSKDPSSPTGLRGEEETISLAGLDEDAILAKVSYRRDHTQRPFSCTPLARSPAPYRLRHPAGPFASLSNTRYLLCVHSSRPSMTRELRPLRWK